MPRSITKFSGKAVVIGCGRNAERHSAHCKFHTDSTHFYTIDCNPHADPDCIYDLSHSLPREFKQKFTVTFLEYLPYFAYNTNNGLNNIFDMTEENGYIIVIGCPEDLSKNRYRELITARNLRFVELNRMVILIPKNQTISIKTLIEQIKALDAPLTASISPLGHIQSLDTLKFYVPQQELKYSHGLPPAAQTTRLESFRKIYCALYHGQSSFFKRGRSSILIGEHLSYEEIVAYCSKHPNSRSAFALSLAVKCQDIASTRNTRLFQEIHQYALQHSGFFKRTCNFSAHLTDSTEATQQMIARANSNSRTGQIRTALGY
jgi:hypothetical protein